MSEQEINIIIKLINKNSSGIYNVGTEIKTMYELAKKTKTDVRCDMYLHPHVPKNITMNTNKMEKKIL